MPCKWSSSPFCTLRESSIFHRRNHVESLSTLLEAETRVSNIMLPICSRCGAGYVQRAGSTSTIHISSSEVGNFVSFIRELILSGGMYDSCCVS